jgi:hypothetical protein
MIASIDYLNGTIKRLGITKIKDSINFDRDSGINEQCISYMAVCQPSGRDGMNLTPIFFFDTGSQSFPLNKTPVLATPGRAYLGSASRIACLYAIRQVIYRPHQTSNDVTQLLKQETA